MSGGANGKPASVACPAYETPCLDCVGSKCKENGGPLFTEVAPCPEWYPRFRDAAYAVAGMWPHNNGEVGDFHRAMNDLKEIASEGKSAYVVAPVATQSKRDDAQRLARLLEAVDGISDWYRQTGLNAGVGYRTMKVLREARAEFPLDLGPVAHESAASKHVEALKAYNFRLENEVESLRGNNDSLRREFDGLRQSVSGLSVELSEAREEVESLADEKVALETDRDEWQDSAGMWQTEAEAGRETIANLTQSLVNISDMMKAMARIGEAETKAAQRQGVPKPDAYASALTELMDALDVVFSGFKHARERHVRVQLDGDSPNSIKLFDAYNEVKSLRAKADPVIIPLTEDDVIAPDFEPGSDPLAYDPQAIIRDQSDTIDGLMGELAELKKAALATHDGFTKCDVLWSEFRLRMYHLRDLASK